MNKERTRPVSRFLRASLGILTFSALLISSTARAQQNSAGNVSVPVEGDVDQGQAGISSGPATIVAVYRGPGYFDESRMSVLGSGVKNDPSSFSPAISSPSTASSPSEELNPDFTPPPPTPLIEDQLQLPEPPQTEIPPPPAPPEEMKVEEITMPTFPSTTESPLPPPPPLESLTPPSPLLADPVPTSQEPNSNNLVEELPSLSLPPPPSLDSIPPFETE